MMTAWRAIVRDWPLFAALAAALMLAIAHAFQSFGHLAPCELCLKQRTVYWVALAVGVVGFALARGLKRPPLMNLTCFLLGLAFLVGEGIAAYHAGVEWKWWPGPTSCTGVATADPHAIAALLGGAKVIGPACDQAAWRMLGLSMAGWNALVSMGLASLSGIAALDKSRG